MTAADAPTATRLLYETIQFSPYVWDGDHDLVRQVEAAADAGFDGIGIDIWSIDHHLSSGRTIDEIAAALARTGLPCVELQALVIHEEATTLQDIERFAALADVLRPEVVMVGMGGTDDARVDLLRRAGEVVGQGGARLAVEFIPVGEVRDIATTLDVTRRAGGPVGVCLDTWHFFRGTDTWADLDGLPGEEIAHVQFDDAPPLVSDDLMSEMVHRRVLPGEGEFDLDRFCQEVRAKGYRGPVAVEIISAPLRTSGFDVFARQVLAAARPYWP